MINDSRKRNLFRILFTENNTAGAAPLSSSDPPARWTNPCNATRNFSSGDFTFPDVSEFEKIQRIEEKLLAAKDIANNLQTKMVSEVIIFLSFCDRFINC